MKIKLIIVLIFSFSILTSCSTKQYRNQERICSNDAYTKYPVKIVQKIREGTKTIKVPSDTDCRTGYSGYTRCYTTYKNEYIPYTYVEEVDVNKRSRKAFIKSCAQRNCYELYGNYKCKIKK